MLDLEPIEARLTEATAESRSCEFQVPARFPAWGTLLVNATDDLTELVAEVKRLTGAILLHAATQPIEAFTPQDRELWASIGIEDVEVEVEDDTQEV